jgi:hypothetical protein
MNKKAEFLVFLECNIAYKVILTPVLAVNVYQVGIKNKASKY